MPKRSKKAESILEAALELCWSQWTALGVSGVVDPYSKGKVIDPEALIIFTAELSIHDARLKDEVIDWCVSQGKEFVLVSRLRSMMPEKLSEHAYRFFATINKYGKFKWPCPIGIKPFRVKLSEKSRAPLKIGKMVSLARVHSRKLFGMTARAEVILGLVRNAMFTNGAATQADLGIVGYTRKNISLVLHDLEVSSELKAHQFGIRKKYRLSGNLSSVFKGLRGTSRQPLYRWDILFDFILDVIAVDLVSKNSSSGVRSIEFNSLLEESKMDLFLLNHIPPTPTIGKVESFADEAKTWLLEKCFVV